RRMTRGAVSTPAFFTWPASAFGVRLAFFAPNPSSARPSATEMTAHGPASITVTGTCVPAASKTRVIPSLRPINPFMSLLDFDFDVHAGREIELRQRIDRLRPRIEDVDQPLMGLELELLATFLVALRAPHSRPDLSVAPPRHHLGGRRHLHLAPHLRRAEVELRPIALE